MNFKFFNFIQKYKNTPVALAVSGGADSMVLMHWYAISKLPAVILHVNHNLRPESNIEAEYVKNEAEKLGLKCEILNWDGKKITSGIEAAARTARYKLMINWCKKNNISTLMTAHQADDQIETFLMNLKRGSGVYGLGGIRAEIEHDGVIITRPLLNIFRADLENWCDLNNIKYFKDSMNDDEKFTRVKIRKNRYVLKSSLGIDDERILLAIENLSRARDALEKIINQQLANVKFDGKRAFFSYNTLAALSDEIRLKFLGELIKIVSKAKYPPRLIEIERLQERLSNDSISTLSNCTIRRLGNKMLIAPIGESISFRNKK
ncbi:MAG: tRNA lysidine(34) synthetase TilS [Alphaproteobacteria bacterium]|jgi:tRNA(Ile)-lysidine synthase